jgi:glycosyltransferase involved in cell wall biosynthesis
VGLPFPPEVEVDRALARSIDSPYFYYPASFWPHKNHKVLIDALVRLLDQTVALVFTGTDEGMEDALKRYAEAQGVSNRVKFLGRVTDSAVQGLIAGSLGVLMPSKLGPTNYPPLEALRLGVPSVVSTAHHFDELPDGVLGRAQPDDSEQWAQEMREMVLTRKAVRPLDGANESAREKVREVLTSFQRVRDTYRWV